MTFTSFYKCPSSSSGLILPPRPTFSETPQNNSLSWSLIFLYWLCPLVCKHVHIFSIQQNEQIFSWLYYTESMTCYHVKAPSEKKKAWLTYSSWYEILKAFFFFFCFILFFLSDFYSPELWVLQEEMDCNHNSGKRSKSWSIPWQIEYKTWTQNLEE